MPLVKRTTFEPHPAGAAELELVGVEQDDEGQYGIQIRWSFDSDELMSDDRPFRMTYWTTPNLNEKSNLYKLLQAFGQDPNDDRWLVEEVEEFNPLIGSRVLANIIHKRKSDGSVQARIDTVLPIPKRRVRGAPEPEKVAAAANANKNDPRWEDKE